MGNALAVILGAVEREKAVPFLFTGSRNHRGIRPELAEVREVKAMMAVIDRELENYARSKRASPQMAKPHPFLRRIILHLGCITP